MCWGGLGVTLNGMEAKARPFLVFVALLCMACMATAQSFGQEAQAPDLALFATVKGRKIIRGPGYGDAWALELEVKNISNETLVLNPYNVLLFYITDADKYDALGGSSGLVLTFARPFPPVLLDYPVDQVRSSKDLDALREAPRSPSQQSLTLGPLASRRVTLLFNLLKKGVDTNHLDLSYLAYSPTGAPDWATFLTTLDTR